MQFTPLEGLIAAPFTPMNSDGSLNLAAIPGYYRFLKYNGINGGFICGSTGEGVALSVEEKKQVTDAWAKAAGHNADFKIMLFLGGTSLTECKELALYAKQSGIYAISFTGPYYFKPATIEQLALACAEVAASVPDMPFYYYHIPVLTGVNFTMFDLLQTIDGRIPNFAGIKYTHEDFMDFQSCMNFQNGKYDMLWGRDENMLSALVLGTKGAVGSTFNYAPSLYHSMIDAFDQNRLSEARELQMKSINMIRLLGKYGGIATGKAYMKLVGVDCGKFRLPVKNMSEEDFMSFQRDATLLAFPEFCAKIPETLDPS